MGRVGATRAVRFDAAAIVAGFDADVVVVPESWRSEAGESILDPLRAGRHETILLFGVTGSGKTEVYLRAV